MRYIVGSQGDVKLGGPVLAYDGGSPAKVKASTSILFTEDSPEVKRNQNTCLI